MKERGYLPSSSLDFLLAADPCAVILVLPSVPLNARHYQKKRSGHLKRERDFYFFLFWPREYKMTLGNSRTRIWMSSCQIPYQQILLKSSRETICMMFPSLAPPHSLTFIHSHSHTQHTYCTRSHIGTHRLLPVAGWKQNTNTNTLLRPRNCLPHSHANKPIWINKRN